MILGMEPQSDHPRPKPWQVFRATTRHRVLVPFLFLDWIAGWAAYGLSRTSFLTFLQHCGTLSILIVVISYINDAPERTKLKHYQAWQVINTAQGKGGSGGRTEALHDLNEDHVPLVGVDLSDAFLQGLDLEQADARRSNFRASDLRNANLTGTQLNLSDLTSANLRQAVLDHVDLTDADLADADLSGAVLSSVNLSGARLDRADMRGTDLSGVSNWAALAGVENANIHGLRNAPPGFVQWALDHHAVDLESDQAWNALLNPAKK
jgi:uncharacterized protein YjbI with pentapeptide repeats